MENNPESQTYGLSFDTSRYSRINIFRMTGEQFDGFIRANPQLEPIKLMPHKWLSDIYFAGELKRSDDTDSRP